MNEVKGDDMDSYRFFVITGRTRAWCATRKPVLEKIARIKHLCCIPKCGRCLEEKRCKSMIV